MCFKYMRFPYKKEPLITIEYHSVSFSTVGQFSDISVGLSGTPNGILKYFSIPLDGTKNPKYHSKNHSDTIQIPLAIIPPRTIQVPFKLIQWYLMNGIFNPRMDFKGTVFELKHQFVTVYWFIGTFSWFRASLANGRTFVCCWLQRSLSRLRL